MCVVSGVWFGQGESPPVVPRSCSNRPLHARQPHNTLVPFVLPCLPGAVPGNGAVRLTQKLGPWKEKGSILETTKDSESSSSSPCPALAATPVSFLAGSCLLLPFLPVQLQKQSSPVTSDLGAALGYGGGGWRKRGFEVMPGSPQRGAEPQAATGKGCLAGSESVVLPPHGEDR